ncbi:hypothetical protein ACFUJR_07280 [Streptomyces sp. NPDC057271]|uniref:hypothetical protein n=1 Tax=unclassified Streptomyces TaxID=2593676 RepID=UPI00362BE220
MTAWIVAAIAASLLAGAITVYRARRTNAALLAAYHHRVRTVDQVMDDLATWRADKRMRDARQDRAICEALYALPTVPQQRKETGQ